MLRTSKQVRIFNITPLYRGNQLGPKTENWILPQTWCFSSLLKELNVIATWNPQCKQASSLLNDNIFPSYFIHLSLPRNNINIARCKLNYEGFFIHYSLINPYDRSRSAKTCRHVLNKIVVTGGICKVDQTVHGNHLVKQQF